MAINQNLDQRLDAILPNAPQAEEPTDTQPDPMAAEPVQVAGLVGGLAEGTLKVIKKAITPSKALADSATDQAAAKAAQEVVTQSAVQAEKQSVPGAVQKVQKALAPKKPKTAQQPDQTTPMPAATEADMQAAIKATETVEQAPAPEFPGIIIKPVDQQTAEKFLNGADAPAVGVDFNFNHIQGPEDIDKIIDATSKEFAKQTDVAKRGVMSDEVVNDMAARINIAPDLLKANIGQTFNAEQLVAARHLLVRSADNIKGMVQKIKEMPAGTEDDKLLLDFRNQLATHAAIQMRLKAAQTETARALRSFRLPVDGSTGLSDVNQINSLINEMGGRANLKNLATAYDTLTMEQQSRFVDLAGTTGQQLGKAWKELYLSSLMYSPATTERNLFSNMVLTLARGVDTAFAGTVGKAVDKTVITPIFGSNSSDEVFAAEAVIEMANYFYSMNAGFKAGLKAFVTDAPVYKVGRDVDKVPDPAISAKLFADPNTPTAQAVDFLGKAVRLPFRAMMATDEFTKAQIAMMETRRVAARDALMAIRNGVNPDVALDGMVMSIINPDARIIDKVDQAVMEGTLQSDLGSFGNALMNLRNDLGPVGTVLGPFIKTVINAEKQMVSRTPILGLALKEVRDDLSAGGARRQMALGKMSMGASFMGMGYYLALDGTLTGAGPTDPERRKFLRETTGWQPFSIKTGEDENGKPTYRSYAGLEPLGGMLGMAATLAEIGAVYGKEDDDEWSDLLLYSALLPFKYIGELPFMSSMTKFTDMVEQVKRDPKGEAANAAANQFFGGVAQNFLGGVTPIPMPAGGLLRQIESILDPTKREVTIDQSMSGPERYFDFMFRSWLAKTPLLSDKVAPSRNIWGEEIQLGEPDALSLIVPFNKRTQDLDPIEQKLMDIARARQKMPLTKPDKTVANIRLNDGEYSDMLLLMNMVSIEGKTLKSAIAGVLSDPDLNAQMKRGAYEGVAKKLSEVVGEYKDLAIESAGFQTMHPDAAMQIKRNKELALRKYQKTPREALE